MDVKELFRRIGEGLSVGRAFGPSYEIGGTTIIPVAIVGGGGGGGEGRTGATPGNEGGNGAGNGAGSNGGRGEDHASEGTGGGFGGVVYPIGAYVVQGDRVRFVPTFDMTRLVAGLIALMRILAKRRV